VTRQKSPGLEADLFQGNASSSCGKTTRRGEGGAELKGRGQKKEKNLRADFQTLTRNWRLVALAGQELA